MAKSNGKPHLVVNPSGTYILYNNQILDCLTEEIEEVSLLDTQIPYKFRNWPQNVGNLEMGRFINDNLVIGLKNNSIHLYTPPKGNKPRSYSFPYH